MFLFIRYLWRSDGQTAELHQVKPYSKLNAQTSMVSELCCRHTVRPMCSDRNRQQLISPLKNTQKCVLNVSR